MTPKRTVLVFLVFLGLFLLILLRQPTWGDSVRLICMLYTGATGLFFLAQVWGFVIAQTRYSHEVESPKFTMLEEEERQWAGYEQEI